jgi:hypothetical protein
MQLVLDIDFDYCVHPTQAQAFTGGNRPRDASVWLTASQLAEWLDERGLLRPDTFAGVVESHEQVLPIWCQLVESGVLQAPFSVLHVDAHPDMMDLEPAIADRLDASSSLDRAMTAQARPGDFLQFVVRPGWVEQIWMLFPDGERHRIESLAAATMQEAAAIIRKPIERMTTTSGGGVDFVVRVGRRLLRVALHTRASLPCVPAPSVTVLAHSPEFVPSYADAEFRALARHLGAAA